MSGFRRFLYIFFVIVSIIAVGVLVLVWTGATPLAAPLEQLLQRQWATIVEYVLLGITAAGLIAVLVNAIITPSNSSAQVAETALGEIRITKRMFEQTIERVIEKHSNLEFVKCEVIIENGEKPASFVDVTVIPHGIESLSSFAPRLQTEIKSELERLTGNPVEDVSINFKAEPHEPKQHPSATDQGKPAGKAEDKKAEEKKTEEKKPGNAGK